MMIKRQDKTQNTQKITNRLSERGIKIAGTCAAAVLLIALYSVIFSFSAQDGEESGGISQVVSKKCVETFNVVARRNWTDEVVQRAAESFEHPVRKLAHFSEYALMGILVHTVWVWWIRNRKRLCLVTILWVFISAAVDEFHQYFVPGRCASPGDVLLDTCGGAFGLLLCVMAVNIWQRHRRKAVCTDGEVREKSCER